MTAAGVYKGYDYQTLTQAEVDAIDAAAPTSANYFLSKFIDQGLTTTAAEIPLAENKILIGSAGGVAVAQTMAGDATIVAAGTLTIGAGKITGAKMTAGKGYFTVAVNTNSTTPVNVFGVGGAPTALTVTSMVVISKDTTAGNIVLKQAANTVATIAKGTAAGALVGATSLSNTAYAAADVCTVESSSAGEATVLITFTVV